MSLPNLNPVAGPQPPPNPPPLATPQPQRFSSHEFQAEPMGRIASANTVRDDMLMGRQARLCAPLDAPAVPPKRGASAPPAPIAYPNVQDLKDALEHAIGSADALGSVWIWRALTPYFACGLLAPPYDFEHVLGYLDLPVFEAKRMELVQALVEALRDETDAAEPRRLVAMHTVLSWARVRHPQNDEVKAGLDKIVSDLSCAAARVRVVAGLTPPDTAFMRAQVVKLAHAGVLRELHNAFCVPKPKGSVETWQSLAPELAEGAAHWPTEVENLLSYLDAPRLAPRGLELARQWCAQLTTATVTKGAQASSAEAVMAQETALHWMQSRFGARANIEPDLNRLYADHLGSVAARTQMRCNLTDRLKQAPWVQDAAQRRARMEELVYNGACYELSRTLQSDVPTQSVAAWRQLGPELAAGAVRWPAETERLLSCLDMPGLKPSQQEFARDLYARLLAAGAAASLSQATMAQETALLWMQRRFADDSACSANLHRLYADKLGSVEARSRMRCDLGTFIMQKPWAHDEAYLHARMVDLAFNAACYELNCVFARGAIKDSAEAWKRLTPELAAGVVRWPAEVEVLLSRLDAPSLTAWRSVLLFGFIKTLAKTAPWAQRPEGIMAQHTALRWAFERYPGDAGLVAAQRFLYASPSLRTVEGRAKLRRNGAAELAAPLEAICQEARRRDNADCVAAYRDVLAATALLGASAIVVGASVAAGNLVALAVGFGTCFELAATFAGVGLAVFGGAITFYAALWGYHHFAPWETGSREGSERMPAYA